MCRGEGVIEKFATDAIKFRRFLRADMVGYSGSVLGVRPAKGHSTKSGTTKNKTNKQKTHTKYADLHRSDGVKRR